MNKQILIIEDETQIAAVLKLELEFEGFDAFVVNDGELGFKKAMESPFDLILLDLMLPGLSGAEVLRRLRKNARQTPVILLTARNSTMDKVTGLDMGADDYITKPFETEELLARIRAALRRGERAGGGKDEAVLTIGDLKIDTGSREVTRGEKTFDLTQTEYELLVYLIAHKNKAVSRENILTNVWGYEYEGDTNVIDVYVRHIRKKLGDPSFIQTIRGVGYSIKER